MPVVLYCISECKCAILCVCYEYSADEAQVDWCFTSCDSQLVGKCLVSMSTLFGQCLDGTQTGLAKENSSYLAVTPVL